MSACLEGLLRAHHVVILMATWQGAPHLGTQLDSIAAQTHADWSLVVSDDGSTDRTRQIVERFAADRPTGQVRLVDGPRAGATRNFLSLLDHVPPDALAAFCDQDDQWLPHKLARAVAALQGLAGPAHYAASTIITDATCAPWPHRAGSCGPWGSAMRWYRPAWRATPRSSTRLPWRCCSMRRRTRCGRG
ncbi:glycosyltransferase [Paracoccus sp. PAMC 22219]|uniref:glycosyltransferase n=1 Tax=Paracoccus sp. PAMC 22219 TaxID=1569209 RepID=UPI0012E00292|nr:glycosyltransferase [Paracoccus sp. PAMC 22219]